MPYASDNFLKMLEKCRPVSEFLVNPDTVKIYVGPEKKLWILNEALLCDRSEFFNSAFKGQFKESTEKTLVLDEDDEHAFTHLVDWMHGNPIRCKVQHVERYGHEDWCALYVLADKLGMANLQTEAIDLYRKCLKYGNWMPNIDDIKYIYDNTHDSSPMRKLIVDELAFSFMTGKAGSVDLWADVAASVPEYNRDVIFQVQRYVAQERSRPCSVPANVYTACENNNNQSRKHGGVAWDLYRPQTTPRVWG